MYKVLIIVGIILLNMISYIKGFQAGMDEFMKILDEVLEDKNDE